MVDFHNNITAELIGIILGDGSIYSKNGSYSVAVYGNSINEKDYMLKFVSKLMEKTFNKKPFLFFHKTFNEIRLQVCTKDSVRKLEELGLVSGNKISNNLSIPDWILRNKRFTAVCVRGLIDTDGCVYAKWANPSIPQIEFYTATPKLRRDFTKAMKKLNIKISKWRWKNASHHCAVCGIYGKNEVLKYYQEIGFNNPKNIKRFKRIVARVV